MRALSEAGAACRARCASAVQREDAETNAARLRTRSCGAREASMQQPPSPYDIRSTSRLRDVEDYDAALLRHLAAPCLPLMPVAMMIYHALLFDVVTLR